MNSPKDGSCANALRVDSPATSLLRQVDDRINNAIAAMNDVLRDIGEWEDQTLADKVRAARNGLQEPRDAQPHQIYQAQVADVLERYGSKIPAPVARVLNGLVNSRWRAPTNHAALMASIHLLVQTARTWVTCAKDPASVNTFPASQDFERARVELMSVANQFRVLTDDKPRKQVLAQPARALLPQPDSPFLNTMKIVDRQTFLAMPAGTLFSKYEPHVFGSLTIKGDTLPNGDFQGQAIESAVKCDDTAIFDEILDAAEHSGTSIPMDFDDLGRDGLYDQDQLFAVWEASDVAALILRLKRTASQTARRPHLRLEPSHDRS